ncbi:E3 ubiquitin-protein ligase Trim36-like isoform X1 [Lytechinus pictus]|uniref:E3 ubiquitin-protein ligase Trim36-like isoform X1 n=1 Tax=Lytechinus pictus TaxID=7653 RepID=UPI0030BA1879
MCPFPLNMESSDKNMLSFLREEVNCAICLNQLKNPRLLICIHSFCEDCLETYYKKENHSVGKIACPVCDEDTVLSDAGISGLRRDFRAIGLIERMAKDKEKMQQQKAKNGLQLCEVCGHVEQASTSFYNCQQCKLALCNECGAAHKHPVRLSTHHVHGDGLDLQDSDDQDKMIFCEKHEGNKKELFCKLCLVPVCDLCSITDHPVQQNHDCIKVEDFVPMMRKEIQSRLSRLTKAYLICWTTIYSIRNAEKTAEAQKDVLNSAIHFGMEKYEMNLKARNTAFLNLRNQTFSQWTEIIEERAENIEKIRLKAKRTLEENIKFALIASMHKDLLASCDSILSQNPDKFICREIKKIIGEKLLHFRLTDRGPSFEPLLTIHEIFDKKDLYVMSVSDVSRMLAVTFTYDNRIAILCYFTGPSAFPTNTDISQNPKSLFKTSVYRYDTTNYCAIQQTTASPRVATKFGIETRLEEKFHSSSSESSFASLSDLRFVLGDGKLDGDVYRITNVPSPISDIATDLKDNIYCSVPSCKQICVVRSDGPHFKAIPTGNLKPEQIAVCPHRPNQVIFTHDSSKVSVVDMSGKLLRTITRPEWKEVAIGCDNDSILYVLWKNKAGLRTLQRFYLNGDPFMDAVFQEEKHDCTRLLLAVSPGGDVAVVTRKDNVMLITTKREFTGEETSLKQV